MNLWKLTGVILSLTIGALFVVQIIYMPVPAYEQEDSQ